jgi:Protein of unknown function (DUF2892)
MKQNMGKADKIIRFVLAFVFSTLYFTGTVTGPLAYVLLALGGIFILTSVVGTCPLYLPFGISTCEVKEKK